MSNTDDEIENWDEEFGITSSNSSTSSLSLSLLKVSSTPASPFTQQHNPQQQQQANTTNNNNFVVKTNAQQQTISNATQQTDTDTTGDSNATNRGNFMDEGELCLSDDDWTGDFTPGGGGLLGLDSSVISPPPQKIVGIKADPNTKEEDWEDDFEFTNSEEDKSVLIPARSVLLNRSRSSNQVPPTQLAVHSAEELLASIPSEDDFILIDREPAQKKEKEKLTEIDWSTKIEEHNENLGKSRDDKLVRSRLHWEMGQLYQVHNKVVPAMSEFQQAWQLLEEIRPADNINLSASSTNLAYTPPIDADFELSLLYHMGLAAKDMSDIFQQTEYYEKALKIAQTDKKYLPQFTHINLELGLSLLLSENSMQALRYLEAHLRSIIYAYCVATAPSHVHISTCISTDLVDWHAVCNGCLSLGKAMKALDQTEIAIGYFEKALWLSTELKEKDIEKAAKVYIDALSSKKSTPKVDSRASKKMSQSTTNINKVFQQSNEENPEEDWDAELGIEAEPEDRPVLRLPGQLPTVGGTPRTERIPMRYRLLESVSNQAFEIVKFPKPTFLFSLSTTSGHTFMHEEELEQWLKNVLSRHVRTSTPALHAKEKISLPELRSFYATAMATVFKGSRKWAILCVEFCYIIYLHGHLELCWDSIHGFFRDLQSLSTSTQEKDALFDYSFHLLYLASKLWRLEEDEAYNFMISVLQRLNPQHSHLVDVLAAETYSHHLHQKQGAHGSKDDLDSSDSSNSDSEEDTASGESGLQKPGSRKSSVGEREEAKSNPLITLCRVYAHCKKNPVEVTSPVLISKSRSSNSVGRLAETLHLKCLLARAVVAIHFHLIGVSPLTTARIVQEGNANRLKLFGSSIYDKESLVILQQPAERIRILNEIYPEIPLSHLKARVAFALAGYHTLVCDNYVLAERLFFEAVYILDLCRPVVEGLPAILSELGSSVLLGYAEVLLHNCKYQYSILCFEATMANMHLRGKEKEYQSLLQRVAAICRENDDLKRCVILYRDILHSCCVENKINEVIYISETLASLHLERGEFSVAEAYLLAASLAMRKNSPPTDRLDPLYFQLQLKLAHLYLESFNFEKGIELLERLNRGDMPQSKRNVLLADLAKAYIKKEWTDECSQILSRIENEERLPPPKGGGNGGRAITYSAGSSGLPREHGNTMGSGSGGDLGKHLKYWQLLTMNNYRAGRFPEAIASIECAIELCPQSSLKTRGQFFYLRGKVFQSLCASASSLVIPFPTSLRPGDEWKESVHYPPSSDAPTAAVNYTCTGDLVQECIASYRKAYQYFKSIGDDLQIAKTVSHIAEAYLSRVFAPVALLHYPYDDIARSPIFQLSHIITKDKIGSTELGNETQDEKDNRKKDEILRKVMRTKSNPAMEFSISLENIENPAKLAMDICADTCDISLMMRSYMNMAELRYLQRDLESALAFWTECKFQLFSLFFSGPQLLAASPPQLLKRMHRLAQRMTQFLFCFDNQELINENLQLIDVFLHLQLEMEAALKRPIQPSKAEHESLESISSHPSVRQVIDIFLPLMEANSPNSSTSFSPSRSSPIPLPPKNPPPSKRRHASSTQTRQLSASVSISQSPVNSGLPSLTTVVRKGRPQPKRVTAGHLFGLLPDEMTDTPTEGSSNRQSLRMDSSAVFFPTCNDEAAFNNAVIAERMWGSLYTIKLQLRKYGIGKITQEELLSRNKQTLKKVVKLISHKKLPTGGTTANLSQTGATNQNLNDVHSAPEIYDSLPFHSASQVSNSGNLNAPHKSVRMDLTRLVYVLQVDHYVIYYTPKTGRKIVSRLGGNEEFNPQVPPGHPLFLQIHLLTNPEEQVTIMVNPFTTLERVLSFLCLKQYWIQPEGSTGKRKPFLGSISRGSGNSLKSSPRFVDRTANFHRDLTKLLSILGFNFFDSNASTANGVSSAREDDTGSVSSNDSDPASSSPPTTPTNTTPPSTLSNGSGVNTGVSIYEHFKRTDPPALPTAQSSSLKSLSFAKKMVRGAYDPSFSRAFVPLVDQMDSPLFKLFSKREMRDCSEQNPVHLYLYLSAGPDSLLAHTQAQPSLLSRSHSFLSTHRPTTPVLNQPTPKTVSDQAISLTPDMISLLISQLSLTPTKDSQEELEQARKIVLELQHVIAAPLKEIIPDAEEFEEESALSKLPYSKARSMFNLFSSGKSDQKHVKPITGVPLTLVCSHIFHIFPWELMLGEAIVRQLSLWDAISSVVVARGKGSLPLFVSVYYSQGERTVAHLDSVRKETITQRVLHGLRIKGPASLHQECCTSYPVHTPLIKYGRRSNPYKRKYKFVDFVDLSDPLADMTKFLDSIGSNFYPIFVLTYADLLDASQMMLHLLRSNKCTTLFIPGGKLKSVTSKLVKLQDKYIKQNSKNLHTLGTKDRYQYILSIINYLQEEKVTPISIFNTPCL